ncbi:hypothetical protein COCON_G00077110 [Conger conger]|uniref:Ig-like domain-containing protein n=1 Tax=Conger conger TaxID=82655 RepID=A0A9Q1I0I3_CONCO|nr:hypothetical protein COCON_G00077110 [Conger conger]
MGNGMGPGWMLQRDCYVLREKALWSFSHTVGLILHLLLCLHCLSKTAFSTPVQTAWFSPKHRHPVLSIDYPPEDKANPVTQVMWKKLGDKPSRILEQLKSHQSPKYYGRYNNRTHYYFQNNTLILDNILEEDKGIYEVSVVYKNNTIWTKKLHLQFIMPPPDPSIKVEINDSHVILVLRCEVESGMKLSYHWLKSGQLILQDERHSLVERNLTLQVNNVTSADCVNYTCVAANGQVQSEGHIQLKVPPPDPRIKVEINDSHVILVLRCEVESGMKLSYHWLKSGQLILQDERHSLVERNLTLQVNNVTSADCVNYTCVAANGQVQSEGHIQLKGSAIELCSPSPAPDLNLKVILSITVAAICVFGVCILILCITHHQEIWQWLRGRSCIKQPATGRSGRKLNVTECPVYEEIWEEQILPAAQEAGQLLCVYTDFMPNCLGAGSIQGPVPMPIEDFGYSTIQSVEPRSRRQTKGMFQLELPSIGEMGAPDVLTLGK